MKTQLNHLQIILCEDNPLDLDHLTSTINKTQISCDITIFTSGEELLKAYIPNKWDLILIDIIMYGISGIETIQSIRKLDENIPVAFVTSSKDYALESYRLDVFRYIEKPATLQALSKALDYALLHKKNRPHLTDQSLDPICAIDSILYLEQKAHKVIIYCSNQEQITITGKLDQFEAQLLPYKFLRCHKSFLVNLAYVISFDSNLSMYHMSNHNNVYIRRESLAIAKYAYEDYLFEKSRKEYE